MDANNTTNLNDLFRSEHVEALADAAEANPGMTVMDFIIKLKDEYKTQKRDVWFRLCVGKCYAIKLNPDEHNVIIVNVTSNQWDEISFYKINIDNYSTYVSRSIGDFNCHWLQNPYDQEATRGAVCHQITEEQYNSISAIRNSIFKTLNNLFRPF